MTPPSLPASGESEWRPIETAPKDGTRFRKRPVEVDAFQWTGGIDQIHDPEWIVEAIKDRKVYTRDLAGSVVLHIETLEGTMMAMPGWWIIRGVEGEIYPCKPEIFEETYEPVTNNGSTEIGPHIHVAGTTVGWHIDKCARCGLDLRNPIHHVRP